MKLIRRIYRGVVQRYRQAMFRPYVITRQFAGERFQFCLGDLFGEAAYGSHHVSWPELEWIKNYCIRSGDVVVDCGANHGFSTLLFSLWTGAAGRVHAFEPYSHNMALLRRNLELNRVTNVICHQLAVGSGPNTVTISAHPNATVTSDTFQPAKTERVSVASLDEVLGDTRVDFIKIDVEGYEKEVLLGARRIMATKPRLDLELHVGYYKDPLAELAEVLGLVPLAYYTSCFVQLEVDTPIEPYEPSGRHRQDILSKCTIVHLFCC